VAFPSLTFVSFDGEPFVYVERPGSWTCWTVPEGGNSWVKVDLRAASHDGKILSRAAFERKFPSLPLWPPAFHSGDESSLPATRIP
jgi:hypothetical protein